MLSGLLSCGGNAFSPARSLLIDCFSLCSCSGNTEPLHLLCLHCCVANTTTHPYCKSAQYGVGRCPRRRRLLGVELLTTKLVIAHLLISTNCSDSDSLLTSRLHLLSSLGRISNFSPLAQAHVGREASQGGFGLISVNEELATLHLCTLALFLDLVLFVAAKSRWPRNKRRSLRQSYFSAADRSQRGSSHRFHLTRRAKA